MDKEDRSCLLLGCNTCETQLQIATSEFKAYFNFETGYPDGIKEKDKIDLSPEISKEDVAFLKKLVFLQSKRAGLIPAFILSAIDKL